MNFSLENKNNIKISFIKQNIIPSIYDVYSHLDKTFYECINNEIDQIFFNSKIAIDKLKDLGYYIYKILFYSLCEKGAKLFEGDGKLLFVFFNKRLPNIPIEIAYNGEKFLGLTRCIIRNKIKNNSSDYLSTKNTKLKSFIIIADPTKTLKYAYKEGKILFDFMKKYSKIEKLNFISCSLTTLNFINILESYQGLHFAGHSYNKSNETFIKIGINQTISSKMIKHIKKIPYFMFFNSCNNSNLSYIYPLLSKISKQNNTSTIIGTQFKIYDNTIHQKAILIFYKKLLENKTASKAFKTIQQYYYAKSNNQWICYLLYGNPYFKLTQAAFQF